MVAVVVAVISLAVFAGSTAALVAELTRAPTAAERNRAMIVEVARRWDAWPAGKIFPATAPYTLRVGGDETARRVGIGQDTSCTGATDTAWHSTLRAHGCLAALRATYLDQLQGLAITVGVIAFPDERTASRAAGMLPANRRAVPGLRALAFPGSTVARFGDAARQEAAMRYRGPYVVIATIGYADGRPAGKDGPKQNDLEVIVPQLADAILRPLTAPARPDCGSREWSC